MLGFHQFDLIDIGDEASIGSDAVLQTHLFEDRVMKMDFVRVAKRASVGAAAVVLYDTEVGEGARLGAQVIHISVFFF
jgi:serine acetyltransferase